MLIRAMTPQDWPQVARIFQQGIDDGNATLHPHVPAYPDWDRSRDPEPRLVAEEAGRVLGWTALSPVSGRACYRASRSWPSTWSGRRGAGGWAQPCSTR